MTQTFFLRSSRETKVGAMRTTLRPNKLRANGRQPLHRDRKKQDKSGQMLKRCSFFFRCSRNRAPRIHSSWTDCQSGILLGGFEAIERECAKKSPELWRSGEWFLQQDNAPAHMAVSVTRYLACLGWTVIPHPPYSPDLAPCDFFLFSTMKKSLKGNRFATVQEVKTDSQEALNNIKFQHFQRCFTQWEQRLDKCIASNGECFEGD